MEKASHKAGFQLGRLGAALFKLALVTFIFGLFISFTVLGNLLFWGLPNDTQTLTIAIVIGFGSSLSVPFLFIMRLVLLPSGANFKWFFISFITLSVLSLMLGNASFLLYHFHAIPHVNEPIWTVLGLYQLVFTSLTAEVVFSAQIFRLTLPFTPIALFISAAFFNRHFLMLHGLR